MMAVESYADTAKVFPLLSQNRPPTNIELLTTEVCTRLTCKLSTGQNDAEVKEKIVVFGPLKLTLICACTRSSSAS